MTWCRVILYKKDGDRSLLFFNVHPYFQGEKLSIPEPETMLRNLTKLERNYLIQKFKDFYSKVLKNNHRREKFKKWAEKILNSKDNITFSEIMKKLEKLRPARKNTSVKCLELYKLSTSSKPNKFRQLKHV